jgi:hypothetical protein
MIQTIEGFPENVVALSASGEVTANDYKDVLVPTLEAALKAHDKIRLLYVLGPSFDGYSAGAAWEDAKVGMKHMTHFERIAVVTDVDWLAKVVRAFGFAMPGEVRVFAGSEEQAARSWIVG